MIRAEFRLGLRGGRDPNRTMIRQKGIPISELVCRRFDEVRKGMRMNVTTEGRHQRVDTAVQVDDEIGQRTIALNASVRLLLARGERKFRETKALKRRSVNFMSDV